MDSSIASGLNYHPNGAVAGATYGNGQVFSQTLTPRQQTLRLRSVKGTELPVDLTYTYTSRSQIASINDQSPFNIDQTFTYDGIGRLTASTGPWGNGVFQYDGLGNLRQRQVGTRTIALSYDANNRLSSHTDSAGLPRSLNYDARGNVTALGALGFTYDFSDQPRTVLGPATGSYTYDGHLRRVKQVVGGVTRYSVYDAGGGLVAIDQTGVGGGNTEYIRAAGMTLARVVGASVTWLHHDHLGSAVAGTNSAGTVVWRESEQPFGEDWTTAPANDNQAGYTGHVEDAATGLVYMQARYYDPVIGRFLSIDPVGFSPRRPDMFNRYAYAANDPVNMWDPDGMASCGSLRQKRCDTAKTAAHAASASYAELAKKLQSLAKAIDSGKRLTGDQKVLKSQIESKFGKEATKTSTLGAVATRLQGISDFLGPGGKAVLDTGNEEIDPDTGTVPYAYASFGSNSIGINNAFFDEKELEEVGLSQRALMGHEAGHSLYDTSDWHNIGGLRISGYGQAGASRILTYQNRHPSLISTLTNTDSYTCLVLSEECG